MSQKRQLVDQLVLPLASTPEFHSSFFAASEVRSIQLRCRMSEVGRKRSLGVQREVNPNVWQPFRLDNCAQVKRRGGKRTLR